MSLPIPAATRELIARAYTAFNARDIDAALATMHADVDWPDVAGGSRLRGHDAVRAYWERQFAVTDPRAEPRALRPLADGRVPVDVDQVVRDLAGRELRSASVVHVYALDAGLVRRMDVEDAAAPAGR